MKLNASDAKVCRLNRKARRKIMAANDPTAGLKDAKAHVQNIIKSLGQDQLDKIVDRVALQSEASLKQNTPKKFFGQVRAGWTTRKPEEGVRIISNSVAASNGVAIMFFLEYGTANAGTGFIYPKTAKKLYVPLTKRAAVRLASRSHLRQGLHPQRSCSRNEAPTHCRQREAKNSGALENGNDADRHWNFARGGFHQMSDGNKEVSIDISLRAKPGDASKVVDDLKKVEPRQLKRKRRLFASPLPPI